MIWSRLKNVACPMPKCGAALQYRPFNLDYVCTGANCPFSIAGPKFEEVITELYRPRSRRDFERDNFAELNNLGHTIRSEDYSDKL